MTSGMLQDTIQTSPSGPGQRFRPYACANHHVTKGRYITSNDPRGYIPVYEYPLNGQWIMMDIDDGYILWTGIWKALGNSKADIVKMIDSQPDLAPVIRRVRGGYLKIQGTWMPYEVALKLSRRVAWTIRDDLIPLFGPTFPSTCLSPDQPGYGQVVPTGQNRRRARRTTRAPVMQIPRAPSGWTVVTPNVNMVAGETPPPLPPPSSSSPLHPVNYHMTSPYAAHSHIRGGSTTSSDIRLSPIQSKSASNSDVPHRYGGGYPSHHHPPPASYRHPAPSSVPPNLSLDISFLSMRDGSSEPPRLKEDFKLPPIQTPPHDRSGSSNRSPYSLPPISSMEDGRGVSSQDSAAVLRRLRMDDDGSGGGYTTKVDREDRTWGRRPSLSTSSHSKSIETSPRFQPYHPRSHPDHPINNRGPPLSPVSNHSYHHRIIGRGGIPPSDTRYYSHESSGGGGGGINGGGDSTSNPSSTSPTTPNSILSSENDNNHNYQKGNNSLSLLKKDHQSKLSSSMVTTTTATGHQWSSSRMTSSSSYPYSDIKHGRPETVISIRRNSYEVSSEDDDSTHPHRPW